MTKIAVCLSGQSRTWRTAKDNIKHFFGDVDYFIHTWDTNTYYEETDMGKHEPQTIIIDEFEKMDIINGFNPKSYEIENYINKNRSYWEPMFYSFMKSVWLKRKYELEHDFIYDIVIKARLDINYPADNNFKIHDVYPLTAYTKRFSKFLFEFNYNCFDEVIFYSDSPTMDIMSNLHRWINDIHLKNCNDDKNSKDPEFYYGSGTLLYKYIINNSIHPICKDYITWYPVRRSAENIDSVKYWQKISELSSIYYQNIKIKIDLDKAASNEEQ